MIEQRAHAAWRGGIKDGSGSFHAGSLTGRYSFSSRFEGGAGSTPEAEVPGLSENALPELAEQAEQNCPVSKALAGVEIVLKSAKLTSVAAGARVP
jgi:organic hydroperoxide reductase OsmC/OhrA